MKKELNYIGAVLDNKIVIYSNDKRKFGFLKSIGASRKFMFGVKWYLSYKTDSDLATHFSKLRDEGFFFSYDQHGWGPSDIFQNLRKKGLLVGNFTEVYWKGPDQVETRII